MVLLKEFLIPNRIPPRNNHYKQKPHISSVENSIIERNKYNQFQYLHSIYLEANFNRNFKFCTVFQKGALLIIIMMVQGMKDTHTIL